MKGSKQNDSEESTAIKDKAGKRLPAIPKLGRAAWIDFKNRYVADKQHPAIEILIGEARFYYQRRRDEKQKHNRTTIETDLQEEAKEETLPPTSLTSVPYKEIPERIRINSIPIILVLSDITSENWFNVPTTMLHPFKYLKYYKKEIHQALEKLEAKWADTESKGNGPQSQPSESDAEKSEPMASEDVKQPGVFINTGDHGPDKVKDIRKNPEESEIGETRVNEADDLKSSDGINSNKEGKVEPTAEELMDSVEALRDMRCLAQFIDTYLKPQWEYFDTAKYHKIQFADLWHIFKPGDNVLTPVKVAGQDQTTGSGSLGPRKGKLRSQTVWRVISTTGGRPYLSPGDDETVITTPKHKQSPFWLECYHIDYDGERFGPITKDFKIKPFQGERDISSLEIHPLKFAKNATEIEEQLRTRGLKFCEFKSPRHKYYTGLSLAHQPVGDPILDHEDTMIHPENIASQVVVDIGAALQENPHWFPGFDNAVPLSAELREMEETYPAKIWKDKERKTLQSELEEMIYEDSRIDLKITNDFIDREPCLKDDWADTSAAAAQVCNNDLILLPARVFAYSFRNRKFGTSSDCLCGGVDTRQRLRSLRVLCLQSILVPLTINNLRPTKPRKDGFNSLKLPAGYKKTVQALVQSHFSNKTANQTPPDDDYDFDLVRGKGEDLRHTCLCF